MTVLIEQNSGGPADRIGQLSNLGERFRVVPESLQCLCSPATLDLYTEVSRIGPEVPVDAEPEKLLEELFSLVWLAATQSHRRLDLVQLGD